MAATLNMVGGATSTTVTATAAATNIDLNLNWNDIIAKFIISLLLRTLFNMNININDMKSLSLGLNKIINARTIHSILVASNLFWYQAIRQSVAILSVFMCTEFNTSGKIRMDTTQQAQLIAAPSVGNILTQAFGGYIIHLLETTRLGGGGGTKTAISIALFGLAFGCTFLPFTINS
jgi:hypothetical protein